MSPIRMSRIESAMRIVLDFSEAFNQHDVPGMMEHMSDDCLFEDAGPAPDGARYSGKPAITRYLQDFFNASPHAHLDIEEVAGMGERCILRWKGSWEDAAGNQGHVRGVDIFLVRNGSITQILSYVKG